MKNKLLALLLCFFLGGLGAHNFYLGHKTKGLIQLAICLAGWFLFFFPYIILAIWIIYDFIKIALTPENKL